MKERDSPRTSSSTPSNVSLGANAAATAMARDSAWRSCARSRKRTAGKPVPPIVPAAERTSPWFSLSQPTLTLLPAAPSRPRGPPAAPFIVGSSSRASLALARIVDPKRGGETGMSARILRTLVAGSALIGLSLVASLTQALAAEGGSAATAPICPSFSSSNFHKSTRISNRFFPLTPGDLYTYKGNLKKHPVVNTVYVTHNTPTIDGVTTVEVRDRVYESGALSEETLDWYAQDDQGNVWYFGELATQLPAGTHAGSWTAGVNDAQPGYIMEAAPKVGDSYCQENAPGRRAGRRQ